MKFPCIALLFCVSAFAQTPNDVVCPDDHPYTGLRENWTFGFTIVIPHNLQGLWDSAACVQDTDGCTCMGDHGTLIPLGNKAEDKGRQIEFYAHLDVTVEHTLGALVNYRLSSGRVSNKTILKRSPYNLAGLKARRVIVRYYDRQLNRHLVEDFIVALRSPTVYYLYLRTSDTNYPRDLRIFNQILSTFTLTKGEYNEAPASH